MRGTTFGAYHSGDYFDLVQQSVDIEPAKPRIILADIPGGNGSVDMTEALGGIFYEDRTIKWTFALMPGDDWYDKQRQVSNLLNGKRMDIVIDGDDNYHYDGRISVDAYKKDNLNMQISVKAVCRPYKFKNSQTERSIQAGIAYSTILLMNGRMPVVPTVTTTSAIKMKIGSSAAEIAVSAGFSGAISGLQLPEGGISVSVKADSTEGTVTFSYREGDL